MDCQSSDDNITDGVWNLCTQNFASAKCFSGECVQGGDFVRILGMIKVNNYYCSVQN